MPMAIIQLVSELLRGGLTGFWPGWRDVHADFSVVPTFTSGEWKAAGFWAIFGVRLNQWSNPVFAMAFFLLFGLTEQKRSRYRYFFRKAMKPFGLNFNDDPTASFMVFCASTSARSDSQTNETQVTTTM